MVTEEDLKNMSPEEIKKLQEENCVFCKIGKKEIPANIIYEDDKVVAFLDIMPLTMGHVILTTKSHNVFFSTVSDEETGHLFKVAKQISQCLLKSLQVTGTNIFIANGEFAGQMAPHFIMHIIPRKEGKELPNLNPMREEIDDKLLSQIQLKVISRIDEVMKTNMKSKIMTKVENKQEKQPKIIPKKETSTNKPNNEQNKNDDVDLDKISELFK